MRIHKLTIAALAVAAGLSLTACQSDNAAATGKSDQSSTSTDAAASTSGSGSDSGSSDQGSGKGTAAGTSSTSGKGTATETSANGKGTAAGTGSHASGSGIGKCLTSDLKISATDNTIDGDPDATVVVALTNASGHDCRISGYAGVDLKTNAGTISAKRTGQETISTVLKNGKEIDFPINYPFNKTGGTGVRITGLVVTPPDETHSVTLNWPGEASLPATDGSGEPVKIGPIGSAGQGGE
ncbi:DUF4232 domain-containing protein [Streptomyces sp. NBC_01267]|uniref:DUF4232 domain-containing protein n=1 Tax=Streptomyces sp. NBC_01267 TaxID=2903805 RepID=UPI002E37DB71|nr:DUF4232 domain-containing protein [Streptomyces sp. NBC_01267]